MGEWRFFITPEAEKNFEQLDAVVKKQIASKLDWFVNNFENVTPLPLSGLWKGFFKLRAGDWRIIYEIDNVEKLIVVHLIKNRNKIYK